MLSVQINGKINIVTKIKSFPKFPKFFVFWEVQYIGISIFSENPSHKHSVIKTMAIFLSQLT